MSDATPIVLVIDDDPDLRASVGRLLRSLGINVNLIWGAVLFVAGGIFLALSTRSGDRHG